MKTENIYQTDLRLDDLEATVSEIIAHVEALERIIYGTSALFAGALVVSPAVKLSATTMMHRR